MKTILYLAIATLGFTVQGIAQQGHAADRQPPVVTEQQVQKDAQMAEAERKKDEKMRYEPVKQKTETENNKGAEPQQYAGKKKSSTKPEEQ
jgi:folylpolyglutamate synthase/dihydropteroate synthase